MIKTQDVIESLAKDMEKQMEIKIYNEIAKIYGLPEEYLEKEKAHKSVLDGNIQLQLWKKQLEDLLQSK